MVTSFDYIKLLLVEARRQNEHADEEHTVNDRFIC